ncbi:DedD protein [Colwellia chukchiensis]|uniref:DedD protein n=1 Tax=Colwellia chukchiensis TaxID=641665 RepID=A0A1H7GU98_9GAMM|nr:SPOR domain-containing protein [Colwellia chukchiensis]SEK40622.1 DedD protein [Colwellia chukchiensis]
MSTPFQNRLVGTIIVAAVAIIFLPDVLDGDKKTYQDNFETLPKAPPVQLADAKVAFPEEKLAKIPAKVISDDTALDDVSAVNVETALDEKHVTVSSMAKTADFTETTSQAADKADTPVEKDTTPSKAVVKQAWAIQLGSFRHQNNVDDLVSKLKKAGYTVFTRPINTKSGKLTKVFVGPELIKSSLENKLPELKKLTNVQGKVARFYPTKQ